jgi:hypothetical protein
MARQRALRQQKKQFAHHHENGYFYIYPLVSLASGSGM